MKAVLISIQPKWCELIASGKKTIEVRKTVPKLKPPFKAYIYCTQGEALALPCHNNPHYTIHRANNGTLSGRQMTVEERERSDQQFANGKVIGEFVCDGVDDMPYVTSAVEGTIIPRYVGNNESCTCLSEIDIFKYGRGNLLYAWHISELKLYDEPLEVAELYVNGKASKVERETIERYSGLISLKADIESYERVFKGKRHITKPPQSWCYVEERI